MNKWFEVKVAYEKTVDSGECKKVKEWYLIDALTFGEAEARGMKLLMPYTSGDLYVTDIKRCRIAELFRDEGKERYFRAKVHYITLDEKSGREKRTAVYMLAQAGGIAEAQALIRKNMEGTLSDYEIAEVKETPIMGIYPYPDSEREQDSRRYM